MQREARVMHGHGAVVVGHGHVGSICALVGINGSGKSTLFKAIMGFLKPARGDVRIGGETIVVAQRRNWVA